MRLRLRTTVVGGLVMGGAALTVVACGGGGYSGMSPAAPAKASYGMAMAPGAYGQPDGMSAERYEKIDETGFREAAKEPLSTFAIDVDTAAYANVRRFLRDGAMPPADAVRIEELLNYFDYDYPDAPEGKAFGVSTEVGPAPWQPEHKLVHIGIQGKKLAARDVPPKNLVFLLDVSGSMASPDKLPLMLRGMKLLAEQMSERDRVAIVVYAGASGVVLEPTSDRQEIISALSRLEAGGSTNGGEGIEIAYRLAEKHFVKGGINRVILATDGDFNVGTTSDGELVRLIEKKRETGVFLSVLGFGTGNLNDSMMEKLSNAGNGNYAYIDSEEEARKVLSTEAGSTLVTIAKDVKIQVEMNPALVQAYRLIGYENRQLANEDFNDDTKDGGELGAGHTVTALYEIVPVGAPMPTAGTDPLKYQKPAALSPAAESGEWMTVKVRYKEPDGDKSSLVSHAVSGAAKPLADTTADFRFSAAVATFGLLLSESKYRGAADLGQAHALAEAALGADPRGTRASFLTLVEQAQKLSPKTQAVAAE